MEATASPYAPLLERVERELDLPQPEKALVLAELAADAAGLHELLRSRGAGEAEVRRRVETWLSAAPETMRQLETIHRPLYMRWASRLSEPGRNRLERGALALATLTLLVAAAPLATSGVLARAPYGSGWIVAVLGVLVVVLLVERGFVLWLRRDHRASVRRRGQTLLAAVAVVAPATAGLGAAVALSRLATGPLDHAHVWSVVHVSSALVAAGLMVGLLAGAVLFTVESRVRWIERLDHAWKEGET